MERTRHLSTTREIFKSILFLMCIYGTTDYAQAQENVDLSNKLAGRNHIYFTHLSLYMTIMTLFLSYLVKHFGISSVMEIYRDSLSVTLPMEGLVTTMFWVLNIIDPTLLKNRDLYLAGVRTPVMGELSIHLLPLILLLADQVGVGIHERRRHYWMFGFFSVLYFMTIYYCQKLNRCWAYPFLDEMPMVMRVGLFGLLTLLVIAYYKIFLHVSRIVNLTVFGGHEDMKSKLL